jgi:FlaA1/EpsC-like NDP-sugar epimerase
MGATKRVSELIIQSINTKKSNTVFSAVRFGNVLGSSGSVIPKFIDQIKQGGPITVTHPEVTRYFMTISEAANLVIQTASISKNGGIFLLDMGKPIKISDLAVQLIKLSSNKSKGHLGKLRIPILFTGLRPGEKLYEELLISNESRPTVHQGIFEAKEDHCNWDALEKQLILIERKFQKGTLLEFDVKIFFSKWVSEYQKS